MAHHFGVCPACSRRMLVHEMGCWLCGTAVRGRLLLPHLATLPLDLGRFVEDFIQANGSLTGVQQQRNCSYAKVRRQLDQAMAVLTDQVEEALRERDDLLQALDADRLAPEEALRIFRGFSAASTT